MIIFPDFQTVYKDHNPFFEEDFSFKMWFLFAVPYNQLNIADFCWLNPTIFFEIKAYFRESSGLIIRQTWLYL